MWLYSEKTGGIYCREIHGENIPNDAVEISESRRQELVSGAIDDSEDAARIQKNEAARRYLSSTDWYVIRFNETGEPIPQSILEERAKRRSEVIE